MSIKSRCFRRSALVALIGMSLAAAAAGQTGQQPPASRYEPLLGAWDVQAEGMPYTFVFEFSLENGVLKGKYTGSSGSSAPMEDLTFEKNTLKFTVNLSAMTLNFEAVVDGEKLSGLVTLQYGQADITGQKRKKTAA